MAELAGFWSYAHVDDEADGGRVSRLVHRGLVSIPSHGDLGIARG